jgi:hypothetical protein
MWRWVCVCHSDRPVSRWQAVAGDAIGQIVRAAFDPADLCVQALLHGSTTRVREAGQAAARPGREKGAAAALPLPTSASLLRVTIRAAGIRRGGRATAPGNLARLDMGAHDARHAVVIGNRQRGQAEIRRTPHHLFGVRGPGKEGEVGGDGKLGKGHGRNLNETGTFGHDSVPSASAGLAGAGQSPEACCGVRSGICAGLGRAQCPTILVHPAHRTPAPFLPLMSSAIGAGGGLAGRRRG